MFHFVINAKMGVFRLFPCDKPQYFAEWHQFPMIMQAETQNSGIRYSGFV